MNIDKLILAGKYGYMAKSFGSLMNIDKLIRADGAIMIQYRFGSLMNIDKLIPTLTMLIDHIVLVL